MPTTYTSPLAFVRPQDVSPDADVPQLGRAITHDIYGPADAWDTQACAMADVDERDTPPSVAREGFAHVDLSGLTELQAHLARVRDADVLTEQDARQIKAALVRKPLRLSDGARLRILYIAPEGFIFRHAGPNGLQIDPDEPVTAMNGHRAAVTVHSDQDVDGVPIRQILKGTAPRLFHHQSPLHENRRSPLFLLNVWIPLQQVTRPLALMDNQSLDRVAHQVRFGLPVDSFFNRSEETRVNDIWQFLYDPGQRWWFTGDFGPDRAYVFQTLSTPHASAILPGEDAAEVRWRQLVAVASALATGDLAAAHTAAEPAPAPAGPLTAPLQAAITQMDTLLAAAAAWTALPDPAPWIAQADAARNSVTRKSLELRAVAWVTGAS